MNEYHFTINNLTCGACIKVCTMILKKMDGVESVDIQQSGAATVTSAKPIDLTVVRNNLAEKGYTAVIA